MARDCSCILETRVLEAVRRIFPVAIRKSQCGSHVEASEDLVTGVNQCKVMLDCKHGILKRAI